MIYWSVYKFNYLLSSSKKLVEVVQLWFVVIGNLSLVFHLTHKKRGKS